MKKNKTAHFMSGMLIFIFVVIFLIIAGRFLYIQAAGEINDVSLSQWAEKQRTVSYTLDAERGKIFSKDGMTLAYDRPVFRIQAIVRESYTKDAEKPMHVKNPEKTAELLAPLLDTDKAYLLKRLKNGMKKNDFQVEFGSAGRELSQQTKDKIEELDLPGIIFKKEASRYYPNGMFASHIIGYALEKDNKIIGQTGIENEMNKRLSGKKGGISYERDKFGTKLLNPDEAIKQPKDGQSVYLTINQKIQTLLEDVMTQVNKKYNPGRMTAIVMDPKSGEVVAMSNRPSYNPNKRENMENWFNDAISTPFEPGSTMKMFTWAAAMEEGVYNGDEWFESGSYQISESVQPVHDWKQDWGSITYDEGFTRSSNVAASKLVWEKIGTEKYLDYLHAFDFDEKTGIDLPGEVAGTLVYNWPRDKITTGYGQATTLTPIQQMKAATAIANDGKMVKPYVISKIADSNSGEVLKEKKPEVVGNPISKETSDQVMNLMESVVSAENGTGKEYKLDDYTVAGKTGTAQIVENGRYVTGHENYVFSFLGMAPKDDPELMMYVSVKQPELDGYEPGSNPVSFIFKNVMQNALHYLNINPDKEKSKPVHAIKVPEIINKSTSAIKKELTEKGLHAAVIGSGDTIKAASAEKGEELLPKDRIILVTNKPAMPDITGWSLRDVLQLADLLQLKVETLGSGYVKTQNISKGAAVKKGDYLVVELKPPNSVKSEKNNENSQEQPNEEPFEETNN